MQCRATHPAPPPEEEYISRRVTASVKILVYVQRTHVDFTKETSDVDDIRGQEIVKWKHVRFFTEEYIVS